MKINRLNPRQALNKAYRKVKPIRSAIETFKANLTTLIDQINEKESEEFHKNLVASFLKNTWYEPHYFINTKGRTDLVVYNGKDAKSSVGVIMEAKKPTNKTEMLRVDKLNTKAFHELVLYYLRERITDKDIELKHIIATNINEWFIFDANVFEKVFAKNKALIKQFNDFEAGRLAGTDTDFFYKEIAQPFIAQHEKELVFTYFDIREYEKLLRNKDKKDDTQLIALYKLLSPEHLLKKPFANDSNTLDKKFYAELLHIIGLVETKQKGKKVIGRHEEGKRHTASLLENAITQLDSMDMVKELENPYQFGANKEERLFNAGLDLCITWVNRILFLKLLEAQLISYHKGDKGYAFLNSDTIKNYDDLNGLFFQVLARKYEERTEEVKRDFNYVPYLNSSLFERSETEKQTIVISNLHDEQKLPLVPSTVLKNDNGKKRTGDMNALHYLFAFLDAYDFSSEGSEHIQEENKALINASVLGLIFEKINGYKDGSFFTPGFITMYMCRETLRRAVVQKFNDIKGWKCDTLDDLYDNIDDRKEANEIINSLKICDPAVGSGHFLVSALNEVIAIKNDLKILQDRQGKRLKEYHVEVVNDELVITDNDGELFEYHYANKESQRVQEALFHEKQTIIENCLFGVDINPNSVKICRLRLWIELLKNAYYKNKNELETLPNIDINIKTGNSLISRFDLNEDLSEVFNKQKFSLSTYKNAVQAYKETNNREDKQELLRFIQEIKEQFRTSISKHDPLYKKLANIRGQRLLLDNNIDLFGEAIQSKSKVAIEKKRLDKRIAQIESEIEDIKNNKIYQNAFEWRFEFPEVLNDKGEFIGFDVVIGNPPYGALIEEQQKSHIKNQYSNSYGGNFDIFIFFIERAFEILNTNKFLTFITPDSWISVPQASNLRKYFFEIANLKNIVSFEYNVFEEANVNVIIFRAESNGFSNDLCEISICKSIIIEKNTTENTKYNRVNNSIWKNNESARININNDESTFNLIDKIKKDSLQGINLLDVSQGIIPYSRDHHGIENVKSRFYHSDNKKNEDYGVWVQGRVVKRFSIDLSKHEYLYYNGNLHRPRKPKYFQEKRILIQEITGGTPPSISATIFDDILYHDPGIISCLANSNISLEYILGIINSTLISWYHRINSPKGKRNQFPKILIGDIRLLPIKVNDEYILKIDSKVTQILTLKKENPEADTTQLENEIDQLVYQLYGLTGEEIAIVEEGVK